MKSLVACILAAGSLSVLAQPSEPPRGTVVELHSCAVYAGGCVISSEATQGGGYVVRGWSFSGGSVNGVPLKGLNVVLLQSSSENLATKTAKSDHAILYLADGLSKSQTEAVRSFVNREVPDLKKSELYVKSAPVTVKASGSSYTVRAGNFVAVEAAPLESCEAGACGEALWYAPRSQTDLFTVMVNRESTVREPALGVTWQDAGRRSVFLGKFGNGVADGQYVALNEICGSTETLF